MKFSPSFFMLHWLYRMIIRAVMRCARFSDQPPLLQHQEKPSGMMKPRSITLRFESVLQISCKSIDCTGLTGIFLIADAYKTITNLKPKEIKFAPVVRSRDHMFFTRSIIVRLKGLCKHFMSELLWQSRCDFPHLTFTYFQEFCCFSSCSGSPVLVGWICSCCVRGNYIGMHVRKCFNFPLISRVSNQPRSQVPNYVNFAHWVFLNNAILVGSLIQANTLITWTI